MPLLDSYELGSRLVCQAEANPSPAYRWKDIETSSIVDGYEIIIMKNVKEHDAEYWYVCVVENWVSGYKRSVSSGITIKIKGMITLKYSFKKIIFTYSVFMAWYYLILSISLHLEL